MHRELSRRGVLIGSLGGALASVWPRFSWSQAADRIRIGTILDLTGPFQPFATQKKRCLDLAVDLTLLSKTSTIAAGCSASRSSS
jgi:hypothetical protein